MSDSLNGVVIQIQIIFTEIETKLSKAGIGGKVLWKKANRKAYSQESQEIL